MYIHIQAVIYQNDSASKKSRQRSAPFKICLSYTGYPYYRRFLLSAVFVSEPRTNFCRDPATLPKSSDLVLFPPDYSLDLHENETFIDGRN